jgi:hypothetical protein
MDHSAVNTRGFRLRRRGIKAALRMCVAASAAIVSNCSNGLGLCLFFGFQRKLYQRPSFHYRQRRVVNIVCCLEG